MWWSPTSWRWWKKRRALVATDEWSPLDDLLFRLEFTEDEDERSLLRTELQRLVECDAEAARMYEMHRLLEKELRALCENGGALADRRPWSRVKGFLARWRCRLKIRTFFFCNKNCFETWRAKEGSEEKIQQLAQEGRRQAIEERVEASYQLTKGQDEFKRRITSQ